MEQTIVNEPVEQVQDVQNPVENTPVVVDNQQVQPVVPVEKPRFNLFQSPWLLVTIPLIAGSTWLAGNTWVITDNLNKPYMLLAGPATIATGFLVWALVKFFGGIATACKAGWGAFNRARKNDGSAQFFWIVICVFMLVSVFASGSFFSTIEHDVFPGLGYATALFIDLVAVQAMRARLNAVRMRDKKGSSLYLFGVMLCAGASAFANVYTSLADFDQKVSGALPDWMLHLAPWFGLVFPALILLLSITADYTLDQISTKLDPEQYREQEAKRTKLLEYQVQALKERVTFEKQIDQLTARLQAGKERRMFFLFSWFLAIFFPKQKGDNSVQVEELREEIHQLAQYFNIQMQQMYVAVTGSVQQQIAGIDSQRDMDLSIISQQISDSQKATIAMVQNHVNQSQDKTISIMQSRLNESRESIISECVSRIPTPVYDASENDDEYPFSYEDEMQMGDVLSAPETVAENASENVERAAEKPRKTTKSTGYQVECDPVAQELVQNYPNVERWLSTGAKSASLKEIEEVTGHSHRMVVKRFTDGALKKTSRNPNAITMESIIKWLSTEKLPRSKNADKEEVIGSNDIPETPSIEVQSSNVLDAPENDEDLSDTGEHETIDERAIESGVDTLIHISLDEYQPVPAMAEELEVVA